MVNCQLRNYSKGRGQKMGVFEGGGGGLTWPLVLRIFGMVSIAFFFAPPPPPSPGAINYLICDLIQLPLRIGPPYMPQTYMYYPLKVEGI